MKRVQDNTWTTLLFLLVSVPMWFALDVASAKHLAPVVLAQWFGWLLGDLFTARWRARK